jgi:predicted RNA binding protein YcfA (HicA-like mRNA interferase family)
VTEILRGLVQGDWADDPGVGFVLRGQRGSHRMLRHPDGRTVIVPMQRELTPGTLRSILRQAGLSVEQLRDLL